MVFNDQASPTQSQHKPRYLCNPALRAFRPSAPAHLRHQRPTELSSSPNPILTFRGTPRPRAPQFQPTNNQSNTTDRRLWHSHWSIASDHNNFLSHTPFQAPHCAPHAPPRATTTRTDHRASATWKTFVAPSAAYEPRTPLASGRPPSPTATQHPTTNNQSCGPVP